MYCSICIEECPYDALEWADDLTRPGSRPGELVEEMVATGRKG
jgi:NADH-quinone oxidoreductase subunit I